MSPSNSAVRSSSSRRMLTLAPPLELRSGCGTTARGAKTPVRCDTVAGQSPMGTNRSNRPAAPANVSFSRTCSVVIPNKPFSQNHGGLHHSFVVHQFGSSRAARNAASTCPTVRNPHSNRLPFRIDGPKLKAAALKADVFPVSPRTLLQQTVSPQRNHPEEPRPQCRKCARNRQECLLESSAIWDRRARIQGSRSGLFTRSRTISFLSDHSNICYPYFRALAKAEMGIPLVTNQPRQSLWRMSMILCWMLTCSNTRGGPRTSSP